MQEWDEKRVSGGAKDVQATFERICGCAGMKVICRSHTCFDTEQLTTQLQRTSGDGYEVLALTVPKALDADRDSGEAVANTFALMYDWAKDTGYILEPHHHEDHAGHP